jgi:hypothetical protein
LRIISTSSPGYTSLRFCPFILYASFKNIPNASG